MPVLSLSALRRGFVFFAMGLFISICVLAQETIDQAPSEVDSARGLDGVFADKAKLHSFLDKLFTETSASSDGDLGRLARECVNGKPKACEEIVEIARTDSQRWVSHTWSIQVLRILIDHGLQYEILPAPFRTFGVALGACRQAMKDKTPTDEIVGGVLSTLIVGLDQDGELDVSLEEAKASPKGEEITSAVCVLPRERKIKYSLFPIALSENESHGTPYSESVSKYTWDVVVVDLDSGHVQYRTVIGVATPDSIQTGTYRIGPKWSTLKRFSLKIMERNRVWRPELEDKQARLAAVKNVTDQAVLAEIAEVDEDWRVRKVTVEKLTNQAVLADIAKSDRDGRVGSAAVEKLTDQAVLADIAKAEEGEAHYLAIAKITDQELLAEIAAVDRAVSLWAIDRLTDQALLARAAKNLSTYAAEYATKRITDQDRLADIAKTAKRQEARKAAVGNLTDKTVLVEFATDYDASPSVRAAAVGNLTDQALLADIATTDQSGFVRGIAVERIENDQALLIQISKNDDDPFPRMSAVRKIHDQNVLAYVVKNDRDPGPRTIAAKNVTDQELLAELAANTDEDSFVRTAAINNLTDQALLAEIATTDENSRVRSVAVNNLTVQSILARIATTDESGNVRSAAVEKLTDQAALSKIAETDDNWLVRLAAKDRLEELLRRK